MVQDVKSLRPKLEFCTLPMRNWEGLHQHQVGVKKAGAVDLVPALIPESRDAAGDNCRAELRCIETRRRGCGRAAIEWTDRRVGKHIIRKTGWRRPVVVAPQNAAAGRIDNGKWQTSSHEEGPRNRPVQQIAQRTTEMRRVVDVAGVELMPCVVVGIAVVVASEIERILRSKNAHVRIRTKRQEPSIRDVIQGMAPGITSLHLE